MKTLALVPNAIVKFAAVVMLTVVMLLTLASTADAGVAKRGYWVQECSVGNLLSHGNYCVWFFRYY